MNTPLSSPRIRRRLALAGTLCAVLGATGCQPMAALAPLLQALAGTGSQVPGASVIPASFVNNQTNPLAPQTPGASTGLPNLTGPGVTTTPPAALLPPPAAGAAQAQQLEGRYRIKVGGSCAEGNPLQALERGLAILRQTQRVADLEFDFQCQAQATQFGGVWTGEDTGKYRITFNVVRGEPVERILVVHEIGHHLHLARQNRDLGAQLESLIKTSPEFYPSAYSRPDFVDTASGKTRDQEEVRGEQIADNIAYCKEDLNGGVPYLPDDSPNWHCPPAITPTMTAL